MLLMVMVMTFGFFFRHDLCVYEGEGKATVLCLLLSNSPGRARKMDKYKMSIEERTSIYCCIRPTYLGSENDTSEGT